MSPPLRRDTLDATRVDEVISDLTLASEGARLFFAVDPSEIFDFCFPISPSPDARVPAHLASADQIADHQAALDEIFFARPLFPVLLPSYEPELFGLQRHLESELGRVYEGVDLVEALLVQAHMPASFPDIESSEALVLVERTFNVVLAAVMGLYSMGLKRFREILEDRLAIDALYPVDEQDEEVVMQILDSYQETDTVDRICEMLSTSRAATHESEARRVQRERNDRADARAIDHLLYLNDAFEHAFRDKRLSRRYVLLYLSSAPKTASIFQLPAVQERLPIFPKGRHSLWRTRDQVFAYVVRRGAEPADVGSTLEHLEALRDLLLKVEATPEARTECASCVLNSETPPANCARAELCRSIHQLKQTLLQDRRNNSENLGLVSSIQSYSRLRRAHSGKKSHKDLLAFFGELMDSDTFLQRAAQRMEDLQDLMVAQAEFARRVPALLTEAGEASDSLAHDFYPGRDAVTVVVQHLPIVPRIRRDRYSEIVALLVEYYTMLPQQRVASADKLIEAYNRYMELDRTVSEHDPEHELVRCLLYMGFPNSAADTLAFDRALRYADLYDKVKKYAEIAREYHYVAIWAGRRAKQFDKVEKLARRAIETYPHDPRFYHGRALNTFAWLKDVREAGRCRFTLRSAIDDTRKALELYAAAPASELTQDLLGVNYNNLARFHSQVVPRSGSDLGAARDNLDRLKEMLPKRDWVPRYPEYFYTEALLEREEAEQLARDGEPDEAFRDKLQNALREAEMASKLSPRLEHTELQEQIQQKLAACTLAPAPAAVAV